MNSTLWSVVPLAIFTFNMSDHIKYKLVVDDTADGMDNLEGKTRKSADMRMYHIS